MSAANKIDEQASSAIVQIFQNGTHRGKIAFIQRSDSMAPEIPIGAVVIVDTAITWCAKKRRAVPAEYRCRSRAVDCPASVNQAAIET